MLDFKKSRQLMAVPGDKLTITFHEETLVFVIPFSDFFPNYDTVKQVFLAGLRDPFDTVIDG